MMAGLLNPDGATPPETPVADVPAPADDEAAPNVTEEEQAAYETFVKAGFELLYAGGEVRPNILKMLDEDPSDLMQVLGEVEELQQFSPVVALAATAVVVVLEVVRRAGEAKPEGEIILHGGKAILEDIATIAQTAGLHDYSSEEMNRAFFLAADLYREAGAAEGLVDLNALRADFEEIKAADESGELGAMLGVGGGSS